VDQNQSGTIKRSEVLLVAEMLHHEMTTDELNDCMLSASTSDMARGEIAFDEFTKWWNSERFNEGLKVMREVKSAVEGEEKGRGVLFG
jgi:Ca2+-binding EF-hand superfamily protein